MMSDFNARMHHMSSGQESFRATMGESEVPQHSFYASMVIGPIFTAQGSGGFLVDVSGRAFDAADVICDNAVAAQPLGAIVVSDAVAQVWW